MAEVRDRFYPRMGIQEEDEEKEAEKQKEDRVAKRRARALKFKQIKSERSDSFSNKPQNFKNKRFSK